VTSSNSSTGWPCASFCNKPNKYRDCRSNTGLKSRGSMSSVQGFKYSRLWNQSLQSVLVSYRETTTIALVGAEDASSSCFGSEEEEKKNLCDEYPLGCRSTSCKTLHCQWILLVIVACGCCLLCCTAILRNSALDLFIVKQKAALFSETIN
jgi:hypothetical protein